jgi:acyl carrier protein
MEPGRPFDEKALADRILAWLPNYMLPSQFVQIDVIPLTASGKKNRRALLPKYRRPTVRRTEYVAPRNTIEARLAAIWRSVLKTDSNVGMYDSFVAMGGDSLKSLMLITEVESQFKLVVPPGYFGRITTVYRMAVQLADLVWADANTRVSTRLYRQLRNLFQYGWRRVQVGEILGPPKADGFRGTRIYKQLRDLTNSWPGKRVTSDSLINSLGGPDAKVDLFACVQMEIEYSALSRHLGENFRVHSMRSGHLVMDYNDTNVERLATHYVEEIVQIEPRGKLVVAGICQGCTIAHAVAQKLQERGKDVALLVSIEAARPQPFAGEVALFFSDESPLNPRRKGGFARYDEVLGKRYSVDFLPGQHGTACEEPYVQILTNKLQNRLEPLLDR